MVLAAGLSILPIIGTCTMDARHPRSLEVMAKGVSSPHLPTPAHEGHNSLGCCCIEQAEQYDALQAGLQARLQALSPVGRLYPPKFERRHPVRGRVM